jgi:outer membrane protein OmpA-like peptidoglycan-associated protein
LDKIKGLAGSGILGNLGGLIGSNDANTSGLGSILGNLLGDKKNTVVQGIANFAGIKEESAHSVLDVTSAASLGAVGHYANENNLDHNGFSSFLSSQKENISAIIPSGLNLGALGLGGLLSSFTGASTETVSKAASTISNTASNVIGGNDNDDNNGSKKSNNGKLIPMIFLLAGLVLAYFGYKSCNSNSIEGSTPKETTEETTTKDNATTSTAPSTETASNTAATTTTGTVDSMGNYIYNLGNMVKIDLPNNGGTLEVGENSTEAKLVKFLMSSEAVNTEKGNWFDFTNVRFKTGSADITDESMTQLKNMVAIAKAFPTAQFKVGGYTDNTGDEAKNVSLSKKRAAVVAAKIISMGSSAKGIISSDGYGSQFPIGDNATAEGKAQNRRVSVNVKAK